MEKKKIGIDIDDVVVHFLQPFLDHFNATKGTSFEVKDLQHYYLWKTPLYDTKEDNVKEINDFLNSKKFHDLPVVEDVEDTLKELSKRYDLYFITARAEETKERTKVFLEKVFQGVDFQIIHSGDIHGGKTKAEICNELGIGIMVEDAPEYALDCAKNNVKVFLIDKHWNKDVEEHGHIVKVKNWEEILEHLRDEE
jgi:uncharacterized HAD superfamily protein